MSVMLGAQTMLISPTHPTSGRLNGVTQLSGLDGVYDVQSPHSSGWSFALLEARFGEEVGGKM